MSANNMKKLVAVVEREEGDAKKRFWTQIGAAFENRDGSYNLRFDFFPMKSETTIQLRAIDRSVEPEAETAEQK